VKQVEVSIGDNLWMIREVGSDDILQIMVNGKTLANYWKDYPEPFYAAAKMMMKEIDKELGIDLSYWIK